MMLSISLLGQPRLRVDERPLRLSAPPRTIPLLAYVLLHRAQPVTRAQIAFALWPDESEGAARANLRRHLHQLQRILPRATQPWLVSAGNTLHWNNHAEYWLDVEEFERLSTRDETLAEAAALYGGDLLETIYEDWLFFERERLRDLYFAGVTRLIMKCRSQRDFAGAIGYAQQLLARDPVREDVFRQLITLRYECGDRAGALQEYERFVQILLQELAVTPMPETQLLYERIVQSALLETEWAPPAATIDYRVTPSHESSHPEVNLSFSGREMEVQQLEAHWSRAARGHGGLVLVGGEAGIGKTRLVNELALIAEAQGGRVFSGSTSSEEIHPYQAVVQVIRAALPLVAALEIEPLRLAAVSTLIPELKRQRTLPGLAPLDVERERLRLFDALAACLEKLSQARPALLILEDLQWAGEATISLLEFLARRAAACRLLILATYREEETPRAHPLRQSRRRLQQELLVDHLALARLPNAAIRSLLTSALRGDGSTRSSSPARNDAPSPDLVAQLCEMSEGHPLFAVMLIQHWLECDQLDARSSVERAALRRKTLPRGLQAVISRRLSCLSTTARAVADIAAVIGPSFSLELTREVGGWNEAAVLEALNELLDRRLVHTTGSRSQFDYAFAHHLVQHTLYQEIPDDKRRFRHRRVWQVLEELYADQHEEVAGLLALHCDRSGDGERAVNYYLRAARQLVAVYADAEALTAITRALDLAVLDLPVSTRFELLTLREAIHQRLGDRSAQASDLEELEQLVQQTGDADWQCEVLQRQVAYRSVLGERQAQAERIAQLKLSADRLNDPHWQAQALIAEGHYHTLVSAYDQAQQSLKQALSYYQCVNEAAGQVKCYCALADVAVQQGRFDEAQTWLFQAGRLNDEFANQSLLVTALRAASGALFARQDFAAAQLVANQMLDLCRTLGDREGEADALARLASVAARLFQIEEARHLYAEAEQHYNLLGKRQGQAAIMVNACMVYVGRLGRYEEGLELTRKANGIFRDLSDLRGQAVCALNEGLISLYLEDYGTARTASRRGLDLAQQIKSQVMEANALANLGAAERELGELAEAIQHMEAGLAIRRSLGQPAELGTDLCDLTVAYCRQGDYAAAQRTTTEMLQLYAQSESAMMHPQYILWAAAQTYRARGDTARAQEFLDRAVEVMQRRAADIPEAESRPSYYNLPFNRQIMAACEQGSWPPSR
ncbi:Transcriptional regulatory protein EmbR [Thermoflexales bacterium]|nr:Transcriptional regulatory protein EmbR [Thermoflexales bacterium]